MSNSRTVLAVEMPESRVYLYVEGREGGWDISDHLLTRHGLADLVSLSEGDLGQMPRSEVAPLESWDSEDMAVIAEGRAERLVVYPGRMSDTVLKYFWIA